MFIGEYVQAAILCPSLSESMRACRSSTKSLSYDKARCSATANTHWTLVVTCRHHSGREVNAAVVQMLCTRMDSVHDPSLCV